MRLSDDQVSTLKALVAAELGPDAELILFGSRVDDSARGGDVDLLVTTRQAVKDRYRRELMLAARAQRAMGGRHVDLLLVDPATPSLPIHTVARKQGVRL